MQLAYLCAIHMATRSCAYILYMHADLCIVHAYIQMHVCIHVYIYIYAPKIHIQTYSGRSTEESSGGLQVSCIFQVESRRSFLYFGGQNHENTSSLRGPENQNTLITHMYIPICMSLCCGPFQVRDSFSSVEETFFESLAVSALTFAVCSNSSSSTFSAFSRELWHLRKARYLRKALGFRHATGQALRPYTCRHTESCKGKAS